MSGVKRDLSGNEDEQPPLKMSTARNDVSDAMDTAPAVNGKASHVMPSSEVPTDSAEANEVPSTSVKPNDGPGDNVVNSNAATHEPEVYVDEDIEDESTKRQKAQPVSNKEGPVMLYARNVEGLNQKQRRAVIVKSLTGTLVNVGIGPRTKVQEVRDLALQQILPNLLAEEKACFGLQCKNLPVVGDGYVPIDGRMIKYIPDKELYVTVTLRVRHWLPFPILSCPATRLYYSHDLMHLIRQGIFSVEVDEAVKFAALFLQITQGPFNEQTCDADGKYIDLDRVASKKIQFRANQEEVPLAKSIAAEHQRLQDKSTQMAADEFCQMARPNSDYGLLLVPVSDKDNSTRILGIHLGALYIYDLVSKMKYQKHKYEWGAIKQVKFTGNKKFQIVPRQGKAIVFYVSGKTACKNVLREIAETHSFLVRLSKNQAHLLNKNLAEKRWDELKLTQVDPREEVQVEPVAPVVSEAAKEFQFDDDEPLDLDKLIAIFEAKMTAAGSFNIGAEFEDLRQKEARARATYEAAEDPLNQHLNRYRNVLANDATRVELMGGEHDYINANHVRNAKTTRWFVATQGPMTTTVGDFWRMVYEQNTAVICMVTGLVEAGRLKCDKYWPDEIGVTEIYDEFEITLEEEKELDGYTRRSFKLRTEIPESDGTYREVVRFVMQLHYNVWPDHGIPSDKGEFLDYVERMRHEHTDAFPQEKEAGPITVHCSAGIGRTGTLCTVDIALARLEKKLMISIPVIVSELKRQRYGMVQTKDQYEFIYQVMYEELMRLKAEQELGEDTGVLHSDEEETSTSSSIDMNF
eukprot:Clim_evm125s210 gene=Clim_evmTU125s210